LGTIYVETFKKNPYINDNHYSNGINFQLSRLGMSETFKKMKNLDNNFPL